MIMRRRFKKNRFSAEIEPDEIFMDAQNIPEFDTQQFEGRLEKPIGTGSVVFLGIVFLFVGIVFTGRLLVLQINKGSAYFEISEKNSLKSEPLFADRGVIYDRNGIELAWNVVHDKGEPYLLRRYINSPGFAHLLGYVSYPEKDSDGHYWQTEYIGKDGVEDEYNAIISGKNGARLFETDALGNIKAGSALNSPVAGTNLNLTVDSRIQSKLYEAIVGLAERAGYRGGAGIVMDIETGELLAMTSYPEYDPNILAAGEDKKTIQSYLLDTTKKPFINRAVSGVYTPGSIVKPFVAIGALQEKTVDPNKNFYSSGGLVIPNPYFPELKSVFKDWKEEGHGYTDMRKGLAESVNTYFYIISGGYQDQKGIGIANIEKYTRMFGVASKTGIDVEGEKTGNIPSIEWKAKKFPGDPWRLGDTYHTAIGQYGFQVTPIQMVRAVGGIASKGTLVTPHVYKDIDQAALVKEKVPVDEENYGVIHEGMRMVATDGTGGALNISNVEIAAKTGTAQVGISKKAINSWVIGFFPYENPRYAFTVLMENSPSSNKIGAAQAMGELARWMALYTPEYFK